MLFQSSSCRIQVVNFERYDRTMATRRMLDVHRGNGKSAGSHAILQPFILIVQGRLEAKDRLVECLDPFHIGDGISDKGDFPDHRLARLFDNFWNDK